MKALKTYHHGDLKQALIRAGLDILEQDGLSKLSLRACAEKVGVSHTAPKNHFGNVRGLRSAIAAEGLKGLLDTMIAEQKAHGEAQQDRRRAACTGYIAYAKAHPALFELMFSRRWVDFDDPAMREQLLACAQVLRDASTTPGQDDHAAMRARMMDWSLVHGFAQLTLQGVFDKDGMRDVDITELLPGPPR